jgi:hypothetical protein
VAELTPEERSRIYAEEKARLEAQREIKSEERSKTAKSLGIGCLVSLGILLVIVIFGSLRPTNNGPTGDILTPEQQDQYNAAIDLSLAHVQASLGSISTRELTKEQQATVAEIQDFMQQAQEKRKDELAPAKSLAERAEVLSRDLVASLR